jgi:hypothetical protein
VVPCVDPAQGPLPRGQLCTKGKHQEADPLGVDRRPPLLKLKPVDGACSSSAMLDGGTPVPDGAVHRQEPISAHSPELAGSRQLACH